MSAPARAMIRDILPYLVEKAEQANLVLQISTEVPCNRQVKLEKLRALKRINYAELPKGAL